MTATTIPSGSIRRCNFAAYWFAAALMAALGVLHIVLARGMFADGAFFLLQVLSSQSFWNYDKARVTAQIVYQLPVLGAVSAGIHNVKFLARVQTFAFVFPVILLYLGALWKVRANDALFGAFALIIVVVHQNLNFIASSECVLFYALATFSLAILIQNKELGILDSVLLVVCAIASARAYEAMIFLGPLLFAGCILRMILLKPTISVTVVLSVAAFIFAHASGLAVWAILVPRDPANLGGAIDGLLAMNRQLWLSCVLAVSYAGYVLLASQIARRMMIAVFVVALIALMFPVNWSPPLLHYVSRTADGVLLFAIGVVLVTFRFSRLQEQAAVAQRPGFAGILVVGPLLALMVSSAPDVYHSIGWKRFLNSVERVVNTKVGLVPFETAKTSLKRESKYGWFWTYSTMSILMRHSPSSAIILNPADGSGQSFDPAGMPKLPGYYWN